MNIRGVEESEARFEAYVQALASVIGHKDRALPLQHYCKGLLVETGRKSVEPMAAVTAPDKTAPQHQSLLHFVGNAPWSDQLASRTIARMQFRFPPPIIMPAFRSAIACICQKNGPMT